MKGDKLLQLVVGSLYVDFELQYNILSFWEDTEKCIAWEKKERERKR